MAARALTADERQRRALHRSFDCLGPPPPIDRRRLREGESVWIDYPGHENHGRRGVTVEVSDEPPLGRLVSVRLDLELPLVWYAPHQLRRRRETDWRCLERVPFCR